MDGEWPGKFVRILRPERLQKIEVVVLGKFLELPTHWDKTDGCVPCYGKSCRYCPGKVKLRYYAPGSYVELSYVKVSGRMMQEAIKRAGIIELMEEQMSKISRRPLMRGLRLTLKKTATGRLWISSADDLPKELSAYLEREFDVVPFLERIMGMPLAGENEGEGEAEEGAILKFRRQAQA